MDAINESLSWVALGLFGLFITGVFILLFAAIMMGLVDTIRDIFAPHSIVVGNVVERRRIMSNTSQGKITSYGYRDILRISYTYASRAYEIQVHDRHQLHPGSRVQIAVPHALPSQGAPHMSAGGIAFLALVLVPGGLYLCGKAVLVVFGIEMD